MDLYILTDMNREIIIYLHDVVKPALEPILYVLTPGPVELLLNMTLVMLVSTLLSHALAVRPHRKLIGELR